MALFLVQEGIVLPNAMSRSRVVLLLFLTVQIYESIKGNSWKFRRNEHINGNGEKYNKNKVKLKKERLNLLFLAMPF